MTEGCGKCYRRYVGDDIAFVVVVLVLVEDFIGVFDAIDVDVVIICGSSVVEAVFIMLKYLINVCKLQFIKNNIIFVNIHM